MPEEKKLKELQAEYLSKTYIQSSLYAQLGAAGFSPEHLKKYEKSMDILEKFKNNNK